MGSVREDQGAIRNSSGYSSTGDWYIRSVVPADNGSYEYSIAYGVPRNDRNSGNNRNRPSSSWQARSPWYSRAAITITLATLVALLIVGLVR